MRRFEPEALYVTADGDVFCGRHVPVAVADGEDAEGRPVFEVTPAMQAAARATLGEPIACRQCRGNGAA